MNLGMSDLFYDTDTPAERARRHYAEFKETFAEQGRSPSRAQRSEYMLIYSALIAESDEEVGEALALLADDLGLDAAQPGLREGERATLRRRVA